MLLGATCSDFVYLQMLLQCGIHSNKSLSVNEGATTTSRTHLAWSCVSNFERQADWNAHSAPETPLALAVPEAVNLMLFWVPLPEKLVPLQVTLLTV